MSFAILTDTTKCTGCERCVDACVEQNKLGPDIRYRWREDDGLNGARYCSVIRAATGEPVRLQCRHCLEPACVSVCPVGALSKTDAGPVVYDRDICMGCRYCMMACPYKIPRYMWERNVPYISKCTMCFEAIDRGDIEQPACTSACPEDATVFFRSRDEALAEARRRMSERPEGYLENRIWGEHQVGGTSVLYISDIDLGFLAGHPAKPLGDEPMPRYTQRILSTVPGTFLSVCVVMGATYAFLRRRDRVMAEEGGSDAERGAAGEARDEDGVEQ
ncbi:MAG: 4Fe-4S binding protein [Holophagae bacterium]|jgi:formate dehydrogenase iron-sulfur subunit